MSCLERSEKNILVRLPRICHRYFGFFECFKHYSFKKSKTCETPSVLPLPVRLHVLHQQQMCRCKFLPLRAGDCAWVGWMAGHIQ